MPRIAPHRAHDHLSCPSTARRGSVTIVVIALVATVAVLVLALFAGGIDASRWTTTRHDKVRLRAAAESAVTLAASNLWAQFEEFVAGDSPQIYDFHAFMDLNGYADQSGEAEPTDTDVLAACGLPTDDGGAYVMDGVEIESLGLRRVDESDFSRLIVTATATARHGDDAGESRAMTEKVQEVFVIQPPDWEGLSYAILANNINCLMCHTQIDSAARYYNTDPARFGTYKRVKLGSLESLQLRDDPHSWFAGTLYMAGLGLDSDGNPLSNWSSINLESREFTPEGYLAQDAWGDMTSIHLDPADASDPQPGGNLYLDYLAGGPNGMVDGPLPDTFPPPFPDDGGYDPGSGSATPEFAENRILDANEFLSAVAKSAGTLSGGTIGSSDPGDSITDAAALSAFLGGNVSDISGIHSGNVYLHGTVDDPIRLNGDVAIDGDLILSGYIEGEGALQVSGNVYIPSDLVYADGAVDDARTYGKSTSGGTNSLAIASGGNVMIGDYTHPAWGVGDPANGEPDGSFNFILEEMAIFNRMEWMKTQPTLPGEAVYTLTNTNVWDEEVADTELVTWEEEEDVYAWVVTGTTVQDVYGWVVTGTTVQDVYGWVVTGTTEEPVFDWVIVEDRPDEYGGPIKEWQQVGTQTVDVKEWQKTGTQTVDVTEWQVTGTQTVDVTEWQLTGTQTVTKSEWQPTGTTHTVTHTDETWEWVTPQLDNPHYAGASYIPRYYSFSSGGTVPVFNKSGHFDGNVWISEERAGGWDANKLTYADPTDPSDPLLYAADGTSKAVVSTVAPSAGWIDDDLLRGLIQDQQAARDDTLPLEVDATLYSSNSIFGIIPLRGAPGMNGKLLVNGAVVAADVGLLAPEGTQLNFDARGKKKLKIQSNTRLAIRRQFSMPQALPQ